MLSPMRAAECLDGVAGKMGVPSGRLDLRVSQQFADHGQALAERQRAGSKRVAEVMNSHPVESGAGSDTPPGVLQVGEVPARLTAQDYPWIVLITGQGGQQPHGGGRQRNRSPASLGVGQLQLTRIEINVLPAQLLDLRKPAAGQHQETNRGYRRAGFRPVLQNLVEDPAQPLELLYTQEPLALLLLVALDVQAGV